MDTFYKELENICGTGNAALNEPMSRHTTFRVGGPAKYFVTPENVESLKKVIGLCKSSGEKYFVIGKGSNLLVRDEGFDGLIIRLGEKLATVSAEGERLKAESGVSVITLALAARDLGLSGMEFMYGIPGSLGGACAMNAGAYGHEIKEIIKNVSVLTPDGRILVLSNEELGLGYRKSVILDEGYIVLEADLKLSFGDSQAISAAMEDYMSRRRAKQPLEFPSAGSTFKRPEGFFAGRLIEEAGLGGCRVGGAMVSEKHCGFIINYDNASASDVLRLMEHVRDVVREKFQVELEPEVKII